MRYHNIAYIQLRKWNISMKNKDFEIICVSSIFIIETLYCNNSCHEHASCEKSNGIYTCVCKSGTNGDGYHCCEYYLFIQLYISGGYFSFFILSFMNHVGAEWIKGVTKAFCQIFMGFEIFLGLIVALFFCLIWKRTLAKKKLFS